jgi:hypothetical protein
MIREHDEWSKLGEGNLGPMNIQWAQRCEDFPMGPVGQGPMMLMKAILNDYWADCGNEKDDWSREKVDIVMSKLYWCWVAWLECSYAEVGEEE